MVVTGVTTSNFPPTPPSELAIESNAKMANPAVGQKIEATGPKKHIWVITGPAGCGKTSVAEFLHQTFDLPYLEGDAFHTPQNVEKMANGQPLTDADRWDWLVLLRKEALSNLAPSGSSGSAGVIITCSALKRKYRDVIRVASYHDPSVAIHFVFLSASEALLMDRVRARKNHYMKDYMVHSQFESLETPEKDEDDILSVDAGGTSKEVQQLALAVVKKVMDAETT